MTQEGILSSPPVSERLIRGEPAPEPPADGALRTLAAESAAIVARGRRALSPRHYWKRLTQRFPPLGIEPERLEARLDAIVRAGPADPGDPEAFIPLPGLAVVRGHAFYAGHWLGRVPAEAEEAFAALSRGEPVAEPQALVDRGLALAGAPRVDAEGFSVVLVPHCDDAALAVGGTLMARLGEERPVVVEVFTVSNWLGDGLRPRPPGQVTDLRRREEETSTRVLGAHMLGLGFWDVDCRTLQRVACDDDYVMPEDFRWEVDPALRPIEELEAIRAAIRGVVTRLAPRRVYLPLGIGGQADHRLVADIAAAKLPFLEASGAEIVFYEDLPYAAKAGAAAVAEDATARGLVPELVDVAATFERKIQAVAAHRSQFERTSIEAVLRGYAEELGGGTPVERLWRPSGGGSPRAS